MTDIIIENYKKIQQDLARVVAESPLAAIVPHLIAACKTQSLNNILSLLSTGHRDFGENRYQEAKERWGEIRDSVFRIRDSGENTGQISASEYNMCEKKNLLNPESRIPNLKINLHYIGALQSNKAAEVVELFDVIHSIDRPKLAEAVAKATRDQGKRCSLYIQVNTGEEPQKAGILPKEAPDFIRYCRDELGLPIIGLMCIPPEGLNPAPHFAFLRNLAKEHQLKRLSMGMSSDWREAIRMGATDIRLGSALFGERV